MQISKHCVWRKYKVVDNAEVIKSKVTAVYLSLDTPCS